MPPTVVQPGLRLLPIRYLRAGMIAYLSVLAALEVGAGMVIAEAWRAQRANLVMTSGDVAAMAELLDRFRTLEAVVAGGAVATTVAWSLVAVRNAAIAGRGGLSGWSVVLTWSAAPVLAVVLSHVPAADGVAGVSTVVLVMQAIVIYLPFGTIGWASARVRGRVFPFNRWYVSVVLVFLVHEVFTGSFNLAEPKPADDLVRCAALYLGSALVVGLMVVMAKDSSKSMQDATAERAEVHCQLLADAALRLSSTITAEHRSTFGHQAMLERVGIAPSTAPTTVVPVTRET